MTLIVEDGTGIVGAESYATVAATDTYWQNRAHDPLAATWYSTEPKKKEGALRETSAFLDAKLDIFYLGDRMGDVQGLLHPRTSAFGDNGYPIKALPDELVTATMELAARAASARLAADVTAVDAGASINKKVKAGPVEVEFQDTLSINPKDAVYGFVLDILSPILNGLQGGAPSWNWK